MGSGNEASAGRGAIVAGGCFTFENSMGALVPVTPDPAVNLDPTGNAVDDRDKGGEEGDQEDDGNDEDHL